MKTINGWDVFLKIKDLAAAGDVQNEIRVDTFVEEFKGTDKETIREYLNALAILEFIEFSDEKKEAFRLQEK